MWQAKPILEKNLFALTKYRGPWLLKRPEENMCLQIII